MVIMVSMMVVLVVPMAGSDEVSLTTTLMVARDGALMNADAERVMVRLRWDATVRMYCGKRNTRAYW